MKIGILISLNAASTTWKIKNGKEQIMNTPTRRLSVLADFLSFAIRIFWPSIVQPHGMCVFFFFFFFFNLVFSRFYVVLLFKR